MILPLLLPAYAATVTESQALADLAGHDVRLSPADQVTFRRLGNAPNGVPRGSLLRVRPVFQGIAAEAFHVLRYDANGNLQHVHRVPSPTRQVEPLSFQEALQSAQAVSRYPMLRPQGRLVWRVMGDVLHAVWIIELGHVPGGPHSSPRLILDAETGQLLAVEEAAHHADAQVWLTNPVVDPDPVTVSMVDVDDGLSNHRLEVLQCRDLGDTAKDWWSDVALRACTPEPVSTTVDGTYLYKPNPWPTNPAMDEDDFAAPQAFHNVQVGLDWFEDHGWTPPKWFDPRLEVTVNYRTTDLTSEDTATNATSGLAPYNNAYFTGGWEDWDGNWVAPQLVFGQGDEADYAYDADVIHHELGHYIVASQNALQFSLSTSFGPSVAAGALNEAIADYFSSAIQGEGILGEYAGGLDGSAIRDINGPETCFDDLVGQRHYDSLPFSTALWAHRSSLDAVEQATFDQVVLDSLPLMPFYTDFSTAGTTIVELAQERGLDAASLQGEFDARGVLSCDPIIPVTPGEEIRPWIWMPANSWDVSAIPGYVQFNVEIPEGGATLDLSFLQYQYLGYDPYGDSEPPVLGLVGTPGDQIAWTTDFISEKVHDKDGSYWVYWEDWQSDADDLGEVPAEAAFVEGDFEFYPHTTSWVANEAGTYTFQLTNRGGASTIVGGMTLNLTPLVDDTKPKPDEEQPNTRSAAPTTIESKSGCTHVPAAGFLAGLLPLLLHRRQR